jgi:hypothetical protein
LRRNSELKMHHSILQSREMYKYFNLNRNRSDPSVQYFLSNINKGIFYYMKLYKYVATQTIFTENEK